MRPNLYNFIQNHKSVKGSGEHTHTSISGGSYNIANEDYEKFLDLYIAELKKNKSQLSITEKHLPKLSPFIIDLDFRFDENKKERQYDLELIIEICNYYVKIFDTIFESPNNTYYIMQRPSFYIDNNVHKDGVHIHFPFIITEYWFQYYVRNRMLGIVHEKLKSLDLINTIDDIYDKAVIEKNNWLLYGSTKPNLLPYKVTYHTAEKELSLGDLVKLFSIRNEKNINEMIPFKEGIENRIKLVHKYSKPNNINIADGEDSKDEIDININIDNNTDIDIIVFGKDDYSNMESQDLIISEGTENKLESYKIEEHVEENLHKIIDLNRHHFPMHDLKITKTKKCVSGNDVYYFLNTEDHYCPFKERDHKRKTAPIYAQISKKGLCLKCYDIDCHGCSYPKAPIPIPESIKSCIFNVQVNQNLTINVYKTDDIEYDSKLFEGDEIKIFEDNNLNNLLLNGLSKTHYDIAKILYNLYKNDYVCVNGIWFEFENHRWVNKKVPSLKNKISEELKNYYIKFKNNYKDLEFKDNALKNLLPNNLAKNLPVNNELASLEKSHLDIQYNNEIQVDKSKNEQNNLNLQNTKTIDKTVDKLKIINSLIDRLKDAPFKKNVMSEAADMFQNDGFLKNLDENRDLLGFENGIYDFTTNKFRKGKRDDYISLSTGINYIEWDENLETSKEVLRFLYTITPNKNKRDYKLKMLSSCLTGHTNDEKFHIWTGTASNGKSKLVELIDDSLGEYSFSLPINLLTQKRQSASAANPELAKTKGRRFGYLSEPDKDDEIKVGLMKELTGGDKISTRKLYGEPFDFKPQFKLVLCCNDLPKIPASDQGTWRRLRILEFSSKFTDTPDPSNPNEFKRDPFLATKIKGWKETFVSYLISYYNKYCETGLVEPEEVLRCTKKYEKDNDKFSEFIDEFIEFNPYDETIYHPITNVYDLYKRWAKGGEVGGIASRKELKEHFNKRFKEESRNKQFRGWGGIKIKELMDENEDFE